MVSAGSTRESCLIWIATIALSTAADSATSVPTLKDVLPGFTITSTPMKPMITALQRRMRTFSCRKLTAALVTKRGAQYASALARQSVGSGKGGAERVNLGGALD